MRTRRQQEAYDTGRRDGIQEERVKTTEWRQRALGAEKEVRGWSDVEHDRAIQKFAVQDLLEDLSVIYPAIKHPGVHTWSNNLRKVAPLSAYRVTEIHAAANQLRHEAAVEHGTHLAEEFRFDAGLFEDGVDAAVNAEAEGVDRTSAYDDISLVQPLAPHGREVHHQATAFQWHTFGRGECECGPVLPDCSCGCGGVEVLV